MNNEPTTLSCKVGLVYLVFISLREQSQLDRSKNKQSIKDDLQQTLKIISQ
ncbi:MAG: hypothetical protein ACRC2R_17190 [Xenococcaceae cyanobacterium]